MYYPRLIFELSDVVQTPTAIHVISLHANEYHTDRKNLSKKI